MAKKAAFAALTAAILVSGCASTRGGQDIVCSGFEDFALEPKPTSIVADIQRYSVVNRGVEEDSAPEAAGGARLETLDSPAAIAAGGDRGGAMDQTIGNAAFGMSEAALRREAGRLRTLYDAAQDEGAVGLESLDPKPAETRIMVTSKLEPSNVLLLSGGGQWGAYGAGLFLGLACSQDVPAEFDPASVPCLIKKPDGKRVIDENLIDFTRIDAMNIGVITGISTGSLQSILLMVILDESQLRETRIRALQQMLDSYAPEKQSDLVDYDDYEAILFQGSVAGTDALRDHIKEVLEEQWGFRDGELNDDGTYSGEAVPGRRLVDQIAYSPITTMIGVVEARDGQFKSVNMKRMVNEILPAGQAPGEERAKAASKATDCVAATTLASSAMPVFHQQLRVVEAEESGTGGKKGGEIDGVTLFDGGVRRSVFISELGNAFKRRYAILASTMGRELYAAAQEQDKLPKMYVLRNGPTTAVFDEDVNKVDTAVTQALRAYELLVNELEVSSIASLRLANPYGTILLSTADGSENSEFARRDEAGNVIPGRLRPGCDKNGEMFDPEFMVCLQNFGVRRAMQLEVDKNGDPIPDFWPVSEVDDRPKPTVRTPANDN